MNGPDALEHIVVLMLENRSFDSMLGRLYPKSPDFDGLTGNESCLDRDNNPIPVWNIPGVEPETMCIPDPDPGELWPDMNMQLFGLSSLPTPVPAASMAGFVKNYQSQGDGSCTAKAVMHYFMPEQVPVLSRLARQFAVSDRWHASAPCQTWPNRFFAHTGTAGGYQNNSPPNFPYMMPTIFKRFEDLGIDDGWRIYFHDIPQTLTLHDLQLCLGNFRFFDRFLVDAANGSLPKYSFIEPRYFADVKLPNDQHPPHSVALGEQLIADVYNALRAGPKWTNTLLLITYDEHGGLFDHVPPPAAVPPGDIASQPFNFDRYGVRVPAVFVSPYIRQATVHRPPPGAPPFDHCSILATLRKRFDLGAPLSNRDAVAPDFLSVMSLDKPDNMGPERLDALSYAPSPMQVAEAKAVPMNGMQRSLLELAKDLPGATNTIEAQVLDLYTSRVAAMDGVVDQVAEDPAAAMTMAVAAARSRLNRLFGSQ